MLQTRVQKYMEKANESARTEVARHALTIVSTRMLAELDDDDVSELTLSIWFDLIASGKRVSLQKLCLAAQAQREAARRELWQ